MKKPTLLFILILFTTSITAITLDFEDSILGQDRDLRGNILLPTGSYDRVSTIKVTIDGTSDTKTLQSLINCTSGCNTEASGYYTYTTETTEITESNFLTGLKIRRGSKIDEEAGFRISNYNTNYPQEPSIDVGNDGKIEWAFKGEAPTDPDWMVNTFKGPSMLIEPEKLIGPTGACQNIFLNKTNKIRVRACLEGADLSSTVMHIFGKTTEMICPDHPNPQADFCNDESDTGFTTRECDLNLTESLEDGNYKVCITASSDVTLAENTSAKNPRAYRCTSSSCSKKPTSDYIIQAKSSDFITTLRESKEYLESNINKGEFFKDAIGEFLQTCTFDNNYCIIPINISTKNNQKVKIYDLSYTETDSNEEAHKKYKFLYGVEDHGSKTLYTLTSEFEIPLSDFDITSPSGLGDYDLTVEYGIDSITIPLKVVPAPVAKANVPIKLAPTTQVLTFDASQSESNSTLTYLWDFGDNSTATSIRATHRYALPKTYKVTLTVTDEAGISDDYKLNVEIFSETATSDLITNTISRLESLKNKYINSNSDIKDVYAGLGFEIQIQDQITQLRASSSLSEAEVNSILNSIPTSINVVDSLVVAPYLSSKEINELYGFETESYRNTLQELNSKFPKSVLARIVSLSYPTDQESFILVKKTITTPEPITDITLIETLPLTLVPTLDSIDFLESLPELTRLQDYQSAKFTIPNLQDSFTFYYKIQGNNLDSIKNTITIILPSDLSPSLIPFNCGDGICNPAEDEFSCPEDCQSAPGEKFPLFSSILIIIILGGIGFSIYKFKLYKKLNLDELTDFVNSLFKKSPYKSGVELQKVRSYIKDAIGKGYTKDRITGSLLDSGWSESQIKHAFRKLKKKKQ